MDQLIFASLSHTRYWYEVGMLKVPAVQYTKSSYNSLIRESVNSTEVIHVRTETFSLVKR